MSGKHSQSVKNGDWFRSADWSYVKAPLKELSGKTIGLIGFGRIGQKVAALAKAFDMNVIVYNKNKETRSATSVPLR